MRRNLIVKSAKRALERTERVVTVDEIASQAFGRELVAAPQAGKETPFVSAGFRRHQPCAGNRSVDELHYARAAGMRAAASPAAGVPAALEKKCLYHAMVLSRP